MFDNTYQADIFKEVLLKDKPVEQYFLNSPFAEMLLGKVAKKKAWGRSNLFPVCMQNNIEFQYFSSTYPNFQVDAGSSTDKLGKATPVSQTARLKFDGFLLERLRDQTGENYMVAESEFKNRFTEKLSAVIGRQLLGKKDGRLAYIYNTGAGTTAYFYGMDATTLVPENHILWAHMAGSTTQDLATRYDIVNATTGVYAYDGVTFSAIDPTTGSATVSESVDLSAALGTYIVRPQAEVSSATITATQFDGIQDVISSTAAYLTDQNDAALSSATYHNWRSLITAFGGADLTPSVAQRLVSNCWGDKSGLAFVVDPMVLSKAMDNAMAHKWWETVPDEKLNYMRTYINTGGNFVQVMGSEWRMNTGWVEAINTKYINMFGTILEPKFLRPSLQLLEDNYYFIQDMNLTSQLYTPFRHAHTRGTGLAKSAY